VFGSIQRSSALLRETWGEQIVSGFGSACPRCCWRFRGSCSDWWGINCTRSDF
jgi:hypothetical protein